MSLLGKATVLNKLEYLLDYRCLP